MAEHIGVRVRLTIDGQDVIVATSDALHYIAKYSGPGEVDLFSSATGSPQFRPTLQFFVEPVLLPDHVDG